MDSYNMSIAQPRNALPHQNMNPEQEMERQLHEFRRTVTIIIWTKANVEPLRLVCYIPTFPYFQLAHIPNIIEELGLSGSAYLDTFVSATNQWEQHTISSVRLIDTQQQRLIYKIRRSLMEGLSEEECPTLREELQLQLHRTSIGRGSGEPSPSINAQGLASPTAQASDDVKIGDIQTKNALKRAAPDHDGAHNSKVHISRDYYMAHSGTGSMSGTSTLVSSPGSGNPSPAAASTSAQQQQQDNVYMYQQNPVFYGGPGSTDTSSLPPYLLQPAASAAPIPYHPHPPLKRWPNDYTVSELSQGFHAMDLLISQSPTGASMTQRTAFERVFGSRYVKSTVCRHRAVWRKAPHGLREQFEEMGTDDRACWGEFVRRVEGRSPAKAGGSIGSDQGSVLGDYHDQQTPSDGDDVHVQEPVMNGIHAQGGNGLDHEQQMHAQQRHVEQYAHHNGNGHSVVHNPQHSG